MKPRLRADIRYVPTDDGVHVFSAAGSFGLTGGSVYPLLDQLAGYLDGSRTVEAIVTGLPERHRRVVTKLLDTLVARQVVYDAEAVRAHQLQDWELERYEQEVAFVDLATGSGAYWFEQFRLAKVLLVGAGAAFDALVRTMLRLGARRCGVLVTADPAASRSRHRSYLRACRATDPRLGLAEVPAPAAWDSATAVAASLAGYDAVLHCEDQPRADRAAVLERAAQAAGIASLHAALLGNSAWVGPTTAGSGLGCWECAMRYLAGARPASQGPGDESASPWESEPIRALVGAMLAMTYFRRRTEAGIDGTATNRLIRIDPETANAREHRFVRHPSCQVCPAPHRGDRRPADLAALRRRPARTDEDLSRTVAALHDPQLGVVLSLDESEQVQLPLVITVAAVNDLSGSGQGPRYVAVAAPDHARARRRAAVYALETAAALAAGTPGDPQPEWAWDLAIDAVVPAPTTSRSAERVVAAGYDWAEAVGRGLLRHSLRLVQPAPAVGGGGSRPGGHELTDGVPPEARELLDAAELVGRRLELRTLPGLPAVEVLGAGGAPVRAAALDLPQAVTTAVETAVGRVQQALTAALSGAGATGGAGVEAPDLAAGEPDQPGGRGSASGAVVAGSASGAVVAGDVSGDLGDGRWSTRLPALAGSLRSRGWRAYARPVELPTGAGARPPVIVEVTLVPVAREADE